MISDNDPFAPYHREREKMEDAHFLGACGPNCEKNKTHDYYRKQAMYQWSELPYEVRALGRYRAKQVMKRQWEGIRQEMTQKMRQLTAEEAEHQKLRETMTADELAEDDRKIAAKKKASEDFLLEVISNGSRD